MREPIALSRALFAEHANRDGRFQGAWPQSRPGGKPRRLPDLLREFFTDSMAELEEQIAWFAEIVMP
jgi:hypothetical protein